MESCARTEEPTFIQITTGGRGGFNPILNTCSFLANLIGCSPSLPSHEVYIKLTAMWLKLVSHAGQNNPLTSFTSFPLSLYSDPSQFTTFTSPPLSSHSSKSLSRGVPKDRIFGRQVRFEVGAGASLSCNCAHRPALAPPCQAYQPNLLSSIHYPPL